MIKLARTVPLNLQKLMVLSRRIPANHLKMERILNELAKKKAGYRGELMSDYYLTFLPEKATHIFQNLRLCVGGTRHFQIDTLILTTKFANIFEVKNVAGTLYFDGNFNQMIRTNEEGIENGFLNPLQQIWFQKEQLSKWLSKHKFPTIPITSFVVIANPTTIIKANSPLIAKEVVHASTIPNNFNKMMEVYPYNKLTTTELNKITRTMIKKHTENEMDYLKYFGIDKSEILTGVQCPRCLTLPMIKKKKRRTWECPTCHYSAENAHLEAINDYYHLFGSKINNERLRHFLQIDSIHVATKILTYLQLKHNNKRKYREYELSGKFPLKANSLNQNLKFL